MVLSFFFIGGWSSACLPPLAIPRLLTRTSFHTSIPPPPHSHLHTALIAAHERGPKGRRRKRTALANAGKSFFKALGLPIRAVLGGVRKLFSLARGGRRKKGGEQAGGMIGQHPHRPVTFVDLDALSEEQRALVEETYQGAYAWAVCVCFVQFGLS